MPLEKANVVEDGLANWDLQAFDSFVHFDRPLFSLLKSLGLFVRPFFFLGFVPFVSRKKKKDVALSLRPLFSSVQADPLFVQNDEGMTIKLTVSYRNV